MKMHLSVRPRTAGCRCLRLRDNGDHPLFTHIQSKPESARVPACVPRFSSPQSPEGHPRFYVYRKHGNTRVSCLFFPPPRRPRRKAGWVSVLVCLRVRPFSRVSRNTSFRFRHFNFKPPRTEKVFPFFLFMPSLSPLCVAVLKHEAWQWRFALALKNTMTKHHKRMSSDVDVPGNKGHFYGEMKTPGAWCRHRKKPPHGAVRTPMPSCFPHY